MDFRLNPLHYHLLSLNKGEKQANKQEPYLHCKLQVKSP